MSIPAALCLFRFLPGIYNISSQERTRNLSCDHPTPRLEHPHPTSILSKPASRTSVSCSNNPVVTSILHLHSQRPETLSGQHTACMPSTVWAEDPASPGSRNMAFLSPLAKSPAARRRHQCQGKHVQTRVVA